MRKSLKKSYYFFQLWYWRLKPVIFSNGIRIQSTRQTLDAVTRALQEKIPGAYLRFGDGDVNLLHGKGELLQSGNKKLKEEMCQAFSLSGDGIFKCLPLHSQKFGIEPGMKPGLHGAPDQWAERILLRSYEYFIGQQVYSHIALSYLAVFDREKAVSFLKFLKSFNPIFVGNENVPAEIVAALFGQTRHIKTPPKGSYAEIDRIEAETLSELKRRALPYGVVVVAMGCSGRALEKRILQNYPGKVFLFDFGSLLDAFCNWDTRAWMALAELPKDYWQNLLLSI